MKKCQEAEVLLKTVYELVCMANAALEGDNIDDSIESMSAALWLTESFASPTLIDALEELEEMMEEKA